MHAHRDVTGRTESIHLISTAPVKVTLIIPEKIDGLNGKNGLLRGHWAQRRRKKESYAWLFRAQTNGKFAGQVRLTITRSYRGQKMDFDNLASTAKLPLDALVLAGIIEDDSEKIIGQPTFFQRQIGAKQAHYYQIEIESLT